MATFNIDSLEKRNMVISYVKDSRDNFTAKHIEKLKTDEPLYHMISYKDFINMFLSNKNNYFIYKITIEEQIDSYTITMHYNYMENKNGTHLFAPSFNIFKVKKRVYDNSSFSEVINLEKTTLEESEKDNLSKMEIIKNDIIDAESRIKPTVEKILDDYFDIGLSIDFDNYPITKQEFINYVKNNPLYIRTYIMQYSYKVSYILKGSLSMALVFSLSILITLITKDISLYTYISYVLLLLSISGGILSIGMIEKGLHDLEKSDRVVSLYPTRKRKKESKI